MNFKLLIRLLGEFCLLLAALLLLPAVYSFLGSNLYTAHFVFVAAVCALTGAALFLTQRNYQAELDHKTCMAVVVACALAACIAGACPYYISGVLPRYHDAFFESVAGFTCTGSSVVPEAGIEHLDHAILLWRSMTQWLGGLGMIMFFVALSPLLSLSAGQEFRAEGLGAQTEKITPRAKDLARKLTLLYGALTMILAAFFFNAGMGSFDALNHAMTTIATGGFSTRAGGIASFESPAIAYIAGIFMLIASMNLALLYRLCIERDLNAVLNTELKWYAGMIVFATIAIALSISDAVYQTPIEALERAFVVVAAAVSTTGFAQQDYAHWPSFTQVIIMLLVVMGGMSGSAAGGVKCIRLVAAFKQLLKHFKQVVHPSAVLTIRVNRQSMPAHVVDAIWAVIFIYFFTFSVSASVLALEGLDIISAVSVSFSALSNFGPALGQLGPNPVYASLSEASQWTLSVVMLLGRLEFFSILVLFTPAYWKR